MGRICSVCLIEFACKEDKKNCSPMCSCLCPIHLYKDRGGNIEGELNGKMIARVCRDCFTEEDVMSNLVTKDL